MQFTTTLILAPRNHRDTAKQYIPFKNAGENPDAIFIEEEKSIGIQAIKNTIPLLFRKPYQETHKVIAVLHAERMTAEAQNAFLKSIEEPPENTHIILVATTQHALLPTVRSRCTIVTTHNAPPEQTTQMFPPLAKILEGKPSDHVHLIDTLATKRETGRAWCAVLCNEAKALVNHDPGNQKYVTYINEIATCLDRIGKNVNTRLAVGTMLFNISLAKQKTFR